MPPLRRYFPLQKVAWQDVKGSMVLCGSYDEAVKMMGDMAFLTSLVKFPKEGINDETVELLLPYFNAPDFTYDAAKKVLPGARDGVCARGVLLARLQLAAMLRQVCRCTRPHCMPLSKVPAQAEALTLDPPCAQASGNVAGLCSWSQAMVTYHKVAVEVEPKVVAQRGAESELRIATKEKDTALALLAEVQAKLDDMQARPLAVFV